MSEITTIEELDALPVGSMVTSPGWPVSNVWQKRDRHYWRSTAFAVMRTDRMAEYVPFRHVTVTDTPTEGCADRG